MDEIADSPVIKSEKKATDSAIDNRTDYLRRTRFLQFASNQLVHRLAKEMEMIQVPAGNCVVEKGDEGDTMYFVVDGVVRVHDGNVELTKLSTGAVFGEIAALSPQRRTASVTADTDSLLYKVNQESLYNVINEQPGSARSIIQGLCDNESQFVKEVIHQAVKIRVLERELEIGRRIQKGFLPHAELVIEGWDIESYFKPAHEVAGDFYDYFEIKSLGCMAMVVGDVCDKGVGAALFMSLFRSLIRSSALSFDYTEWGNRDDRKYSSPSFADVLDYSIRLANQYVATTHAKDSMFATVFFALLDPKTGEFSYINAGHEAPCLIAPGGKITRLETTGPIVGLFTEAQHCVKSGKIAEGEVLLSFTDGISEAKNYKNKEFGEERVLEILKPISTGVKEAVVTLVSAVHEFVGSAKQFDDITVLAVERHKSGN
ncbi:PP2C family protein-serine/threonine phosphatase [Kaarinaea lacus]